MGQTNDELDAVKGVVITALNDAGITAVDVDKWTLNQRLSGVVVALGRGLPQDKQKTAWVRISSIDTEPRRAVSNGGSADNARIALSVYVPNPATSEAQLESAERTLNDILDVLEAGAIVWPSDLWKKTAVARPTIRPVSPYSGYRIGQLNLLLIKV